MSTEVLRDIDPQSNQVVEVFGPVDGSLSPESRLLIQQAVTTRVPCVIRSDPDSIVANGSKKEFKRSAQKLRGLHVLRTAAIIHALRVVHPTVDSKPEGVMVFGSHTLQHVDGLLAPYAQVNTAVPARLEEPTSRIILRTWRMSDASKTLLQGIVGRMVDRRRIPKSNTSYSVGSHEDYSIKPVLEQSDGLYQVYDFAVGHYDTVVFPNGYNACVDTDRMDPFLYTHEVYSMGAHPDQSRSIQGTVVFDASTPV